MLRFWSSRTVLHGDLVGGRRTQDGCEAGHAAVHQLDAQLAQDRVGDEALEPVLDRLAVQVPQGTGHLLAQHRGRAGVQPVTEIRQPQLVRRHGGQQLAAVGQDGFEFAQRFDLQAHQRVDHRQVEGRFRKLHLLVFAVLLNSFREFGFRFFDERGGTSNGRRHHLA